MSTGITKQDMDDLKAAFNKADWRAPEKNFTQMMLIFLMASLIISSVGMIFWEALFDANIFASASVLSILSMVGASIQIYSYTSDNKGY